MITGARAPMNSLDYDCTNWHTCVGLAFGRSVSWLGLPFVYQPYTSPFLTQCAIEGRGLIFYGKSIEYDRYSQLVTSPYLHYVMLDMQQRVSCLRKTRTTGDEANDDSTSASLPANQPIHSRLQHQTFPAPTCRSARLP